jgi:hypothetical protein
MKEKAQRQALAASQPVLGEIRGPAPTQAEQAGRTTGRMMGVNAESKSTS